MADASLPETVIPATPVIVTIKTEGSASGNMAYALFVLFCFWAATLLLDLVVRTPGIVEHLVQSNDASRPRIEMSLAVSTVFGLVPFLLGALTTGIVALTLRLRHRQLKL